MVLVNTFFKTRENQLATCKSEETKSNRLPIYRRIDFREIQDCRLMNGEDLAGQQRMVLARMKVTEEGKRIERRQRKIKWWRLKESGAATENKAKVLENWIKADNVQEWWEEHRKMMRRVAEEALGKTSGKKPQPTKKHGGGTMRFKIV